VAGDENITKQDLREALGEQTETLVREIRDPILESMSQNTLRFERAMQRLAAEIRADVRAHRKEFEAYVQVWRAEIRADRERLDQILAEGRADRERLNEILAEGRAGRLALFEMLDRLPPRPGSGPQPAT
jgi:hypothetical protein